FAEGAGEASFSGAELSVEGDDESGCEVVGELECELFCIGFAVAVEAERFVHGRC
ncbi:MAG: hypothetical protein RL215_880, partial [Planctomycetota bacterium]